jgi:DNA end-binding protein Ku
VALRAYWKGYLKLSLVSCPVRLYPATSSSSRVSLHLLHKDTHNRIRMQPTDPDLVKGYEFEKDHYVVLEEDEIERLQVETSKTIAIEKFVDRSEISSVYYDSPYYLAPDGAVAEEAYRVIRAAMAETGRTALARVVLSRRERPVAIDPHGKGLLLTTLRPSKEVRDAAPYFEEIGDDAPDPEMLELAKRIIEQKTAPFEQGEFEDRYENALLELIQAKMKGRKPVVAAPPARPNVINLMDALKKSLGKEAKGDEPSPARETPRSRAKPKGRLRKAG